MPLVALTIEPDRFAPNTEGVRELTLGTDLMDDTYYDTHGYNLLGNAVELRGRARWDNATTVRRLLIAAKFGTEIDAEGNKVNTKVDIRTDSGMTHLATEKVATPVEQFTISVIPTDTRHGTLVMEWGDFRWTAPIVMQ